MDKPLELINEFLVQVYNDIMMIEEIAIKQGKYNDISIREMHIVEVIGMNELKPMKEIAKTLNITVGTLTVAINNLEKKGYVNRVKSDTDRRVVKLSLTTKGRAVFRIHRKFHKDMVEHMLVGLSDGQRNVLSDALQNLHIFFTGQYSRLQ